MKKLLSALLAALACLLLLAPRAGAMSEEEIDSEAVYELFDLTGRRLTALSHRVYEGDEYIAGDNQLYRVTEVDDQSARAYAAPMGEEPAPLSDRPVEVFSALARESKQTEGKKLIAMYSTHSDESYIQGDGDSSLLKNAGIYDVDQALKQALEERGIEVLLDERSSLPHDSEAYSRSRRIATELLKKTPDALLDVHRDGIPDEAEYETTVDGEETSKVRLLVGRSNPNASANREFAKQLKAAADEMYPGLVKDIFIGKGNYNQELYPQSILLEFGTHTIEKDKAVSATSYMAEVLDKVLYGSSASAAGNDKKAAQNKAGGVGIVWLVVVAALAVGIYALISTGTLKRAWAKVGRGVSETTGGLFGRKRR